MIDKLNRKLRVLVLTLLIPFASHVHAGLIEANVGNHLSGLLDGSLVALPDINNAQLGQPLPFDKINGADEPPLLPPPPDVLPEPLDPGPVSWLFNYGIITDTILSATLSFGIWDLDSASSGSQLQAFSMGGLDHTAPLDGLFEGAATVDSQYSVFNIAIDAAQFAALATGSFGASLDIGGSGLVSPLFGPFAGQTIQTPGNGFALIYSTLTINTQDSTPPPPPGQIPEPNIIAMFLLSLLALRLKLAKK
ncbi:hypothetical protein HII17_18580 [Thalassotalea sp. M1531]|uniref:PEP-CTERM sorting domain-containing protein n=1 Tax=Thalassotalea algicola TaxID=2716224 RepID=A0A7Y0Q8K4_9GAMM|nr:hypothetical protein [Thalassotalea algicola]NMP33558.1 hypothetical protein [Thalassotalea algicola]